MNPVEEKIKKQHFLMQASKKKCELVKKKIRKIILIKKIIVVNKHKLIIKELKLNLNRYIKTSRPNEQEILNFELFFVVGNTIRLQNMILKGKLS